MENSNLHVAILASPGMGHLIPVLVLGNRLATRHNVKVTILVVTTISSTSVPKFLKALELDKSNSLEIVELPPVDISNLIDSMTKVGMQLRLMVREALPSIRSTISAMKPRPDAVIFDYFTTEVLQVARELTIIANYLFIASNAWFTALYAYVPVLDREIKGQYVDKTESLEIPNCKPVRPEDVVDPMIDRDEDQYKDFIKRGKEFPFFDGILLNTWEDLETVSLEALRGREILEAPIYPIGPLIRPVEPVGPKSEVIEWLDRQPIEPVLFVSFGSGGVLSYEQIIELAWGLELSQQRFIWVVRQPMLGSPDDAFFTTKSFSDSPLDYLPKEFLTRTEDRGLVVPTWGEQVEILGHPSTGAFLSHCGWNSTLESITNGVPLIAWPLYAEQRLNATFLVEELGVALRPKVLPTKQVVTREEIEKMVRTILVPSQQGMEMRNKIKELKVSAANALSEGGSSHNSACEFLKDISAKLGSFE